MEDQNQQYNLNRKSMSNVSEDGIYGSGLRESTADGNHSDDEDNRIHPKFASGAAGGGQGANGPMGLGQRPTSDALDGKD